MDMFELSFAGGRAFQLHERAMGDLASEYDWSQLDPTKHDSQLVERARHSWTENALNEFRTAVTMAQLTAELGQAAAPLDIWSMASRFPTEELLHVELCARIAMTLGGATSIKFDPVNVRYNLSAELTPTQRANELIVALCCVGEAVSFPLIQGAMRATTNPLIKTVLKRVVKDEALHGALGWEYLDWAAPNMSTAEKARLGAVATRALGLYTPLWERLESQLVSFDRVEEYNALGWMDPASYTKLAESSVIRDVIEPLAKHGIDAKRPLLKSVG